VTARPTVAVIVPFAGSDEQLRRCLAGLERVAVVAGDELIVADNAGRTTGHRGVHVVPAAGVRAPGFARNRGAAAARAEWLVFIDADTRPIPDLLDRYFDPLPAARTAILAGGIADVAGSSSSAARRSAHRGQMSDQVTLRRPEHPYAQSANLAVRRGAFQAVGGFAEAARAGEDADLCWRLFDAGWELEERPGAAVEHLTRTTLGALLTQLARHGAGAAWLERRYPGRFPALGPRAVARRVGRDLTRAAGALARRQGTDAVDALLDAAEAVAFETGRALPNHPRRRA
jgi:cellulose synthase/poly-beta-1,6-N-acetylglucosamine synthase-like glycosyltransferase